MYMKTIEISRPKNERYYSEGKIKVLIDGIQTLKISQGEKQYLDLPSGNHTLRATTILNMGSKEITINNEHITAIEVSVNPDFNFSPHMAITSIPFILYILFKVEINWIRVVMVMLMIVMTFFLIRMLIKGKTQAIIVKTKE